jgi:peroxiredoxin
MPIKVGDKMPSGTLTLATADGPQKVSADDYFKGKKVVLFSLPGAFTPTCDAKHLPGFVEKAADIKKKGVATIACLSRERRVRDEGVGQSAEHRRQGRHAGRR